MSRIRIIIESFFLFLYNPYFYFFFNKFNIYQGKIRKICTPGLNCYSCPLSVGACPIGALQAVSSGFKYIVSGYVISFLSAIGIIGGRIVCGYACPFGWFQEWLHKIPGPKFKAKWFFKYGKYLKIAILIIFVFTIPALEYYTKGFGSPAFCKYICPAGTLEAGIPLTLLKPNLRSLIGFLFYFKFTILLLIILFSYFTKRFFCRALCPLGAFYGIFNKFSLVKLDWNKEKCVNCNKCEKVCPMDLEKEQFGHDIDCIKCFECKRVCPTKCITVKT